PPVAQQPALHGRCLVGRQVVQDDVDVQVLGDVAVDLVQERDEVGGGVRRADVGDHLPGGDLQGGEQVTGAVALVVVGGPCRGGRQHRQRGRGAVERLDLGLLVHREHRGGDRRVHVQGDDVADLVHELRVRGDLELVLAPG